MPEPAEFRVIVIGVLLPEKSRAEVLEALARLFHSTPAAMQRLLAGKPVALTKAYSRAQAENICRAIRAAGAACRMEAIEAGDSAAPGDIDDTGDPARAPRPARRRAGNKARGAGAPENAGDESADAGDETIGDDDREPARAAPESAERHAALLHFVGVNIEYYRRQFAKFGAIDRPKFALTWHWPAFFAFFLWAAYRKLWQWAAAHLFGGLFLVLAFDPGPVYLAWAALWPLVANYLYYRHACRRLFSEGGVLDDAMHSADGVDGVDGAAEVDRDELFAAAEAAGGVSRAAVAAGLLLVLLSSMAFNHLITERVLQRAGTTGGGSELLPSAGALQSGDGASLDSAALSPRATRTVTALNIIADGMQFAASDRALDDPELALALMQRAVEYKRFADGWGTACSTPPMTSCATSISARRERRLRHLKRNFPLSGLNILIIGGGGREHALAWKAAQSVLVARVYVAPGNAGSALEPRVENIDLAAEDIGALVKFAAEARIDLTVVGPEAPLVAGAADRFAAAGLAVFGPTAAAARLEGSKTFAKDFMRRHAIPTAAWGSFTAADEANKALDDFACPVVVKADGLAAGKGVVIARTRAEAADAIAGMLSGARHGAAGRRVVVEEFLPGEEVSFICMVAGQAILPLASSQDHKAAHDGDTGPNTGGMGACSPAPLVDAAAHARIMDAVMRPTVAGLAADGAPYTGFLYAGLMLGDDGVPRVLEFNCRLGDPETQPVLMRLRSDLVAHCRAAVRGELAGETAQWDDACALGVVLAAAGYPGEYETGGVIRGLDGAGGSDGLDGAAGDSAAHKIFHAGTALDGGRVVTAGGRVLCATAAAPTLRAAQTAAYRLAAGIDWPGRWYRTDIGHRAIQRQETKRG